MIYLLHGDDTAASRKYLTDLVEGLTVTTFDGKSLTIPTLEEAISSGGLFGEAKAVVIEGLFAKNAKKKDFVTFLNNHEVQIILVLWEEKKILKTSFASLKKASVQDFLLPSYYFQFLDNFAPSNKKNSFLLYQKLLTNYAPEQLFFSLLKRVRLLAILASGSNTQELAKMSPWQMNNLQKQVRMWKKDSLLRVYEALKQTEIRLKTGKLPVSLSKHLDIVILSELT